MSRLAQAQPGGSQSQEQNQEQRLPNDGRPGPGDLPRSGGLLP